jgi:hypothetical protein
LARRISAEPTSSEWTSVERTSGGRISVARTSVARTSAEQIYAERTSAGKPTSAARISAQRTSRTPTSVGRTRRNSWVRAGPPRADHRSYKRNIPATWRPATHPHPANGMSATGISRLIVRSPEEARQLIRDRLRDVGGRGEQSHRLSFHGTRLHGGHPATTPSAAGGECTVRPVR